MHLVDRSQAKILVENDIISLERISSDIKNKTALISSCSVIVAVDARQIKQFIKKKMLADKHLSIQRKRN